MDTKWGITTLFVGSYLMALGFAGINATSGAALAVYVVVLIVGFVVAGWSAVLPWDGAKARPLPDAPGPVSKH
jgi:arginine exporter protein ArgO